MISIFKAILYKNCVFVISKRKIRSPELSQLTRTESLKPYLYFSKLSLNPLSPFLLILSTTLRWHFTTKLEASRGSLMLTFLLCRPC
ncbi:hypothetical protein ACET3Z_030205 [Daucus carota]